jgi:sulfate adenylyltransferase subunit 1 (EFTu-like GTPase family)
MRWSLVREIKIFGRYKTSAEIFESIGMVLQPPCSAERGSILVQNNNIPDLNDTFRASVFWMSDTPWVIGRPHQVQCSTQEVPCRIETITTKMNSSTLELLEKDIDRLHKYEVGDVVISTERPVFTESFSARGEFGRCVVKEEGRVVGVGIIL